MHPRPAACSLLVLIAWLAASCASPAAPAASRPGASAPPAGPAAGAVAPPGPLATPLKVRMGSVSSLVDGPFYIGLDRGYFAEAGLDVEDVRSDAVTRLIAPLAAGQLDLISATVAAGLYNAFAREIDVRIVADKGAIVPGHGNAGLVVRQDLWDSGTIRSLADLRGRRVAAAGYQAGSAVALFLGYALDRRGMSINDLEVADIALNDTMAALGNRSVDAAMQIEPLLTVGVANGLFTVMHRSDELYPNLQSAFILYSADFARTQNEAGRRWMVGYLRAVRDYHDAFVKGRGLDEVVAILAQHTGVKDHGLYRQMVSSYFNPNGRLNVDTLVEAQEWFAAHGYVPQKVDVAALVDYQFVDYALSVLGEYR